MDRDEILRQGKDIADKLRVEAEKLRVEVGQQATQHEQTIKGALGKAVGFVNDKTGGKYAEQVDKVAGLVEQGVDKIAEGGRGPGDTPPPAR